MSKEKGIVVAASDTALASLASEFPVEPTFNRIQLPRLGFVSQDKTEGKGKTLKVVTEAGTFFVERESKKTDDEGKKVWERTELGKDFEGIILFQRKQLRMYDEATELFTSSPVYDSDDEIVPLFCDKKEVGRGKPEDLQSRYLYMPKGSDKQKSALEVNRILYVLNEGEIFQLNLRGSSMYSYLGYVRKVTPNTVLTAFNSEAQEKGDVEWNRITFTALRKLTAEEVKQVRASLDQIKSGISQEKGFYAGKDKGVTQGADESDEDFEARKESIKNF